MGFNGKGMEWNMVHDKSMWTPPNITYFGNYYMDSRWTPDGFQLILSILMIMLWTPGGDSMDSIRSTDGIR